MPEIEPKDQTLKQLTGLHLWHAPMSSCSQRVRIVLEENKLSFESHVIDLEKDEHATEEYQAIHPKGLVPALVDDGHLFVESIDIIRHLAGSESPLLSCSSGELLDMADEAQLDLKLLTFEFLFRAGPAPSADKSDAFQQNHQNQWLKQFRKDFGQGFERDRIDAAVVRTNQGFQYLETLLQDGRSYLAGDNFSLSDIAWMPNVHRFKLMAWPFDRTPMIEAWFKRIASRDSYTSALLAWQHEPAVGAFTQYTQQRRVDETDISRFGNLSELS